MNTLVQKSLLHCGMVVIGLLLSTVSLAEEELLLDDGSKIRGEILSMNNGVYEIRTESMGTIKLGGHQIKSITTVSPSSFVNGSSLTRSAENSNVTNSNAVVSSTTAVPAGVPQSAFQSMQISMTQSAAIMSTIMELQNDPQVRAVLADPEVMRAIQNFDLDALAKNPKIKALMDNPRVRSIQGAVQ